MLHEFDLKDSSSEEGKDGQECGGDQTKNTVKVVTTSVSCGTDTAKDINAVAVDSYSSCDDDTISFLGVQELESWADLAGDC